MPGVELRTFSTHPPSHLHLVVVEVPHHLGRPDVEVAAVAVVAEPAALPLQPRFRVARVSIAAGRGRVPGAVVLAPVQVDAEQVARVGLKLRPAEKGT